ncbi:MAG: hypothetical protein AB7G93_02355 [Bdellovibrionales bacterium]
MRSIPFLFLGLVGLQLFLLQTYAAQKKAIPIKTAKNNFKKSLLRHCHEGNGQACFDYGNMLLRAQTKRDKKVGKIYIRRACQLAYAPACARSTASALPNADTTIELAGCYRPEIIKSARFTVIRRGLKIGRVTRESVWEQSGLRRGDTILKINGDKLRQEDQLIEGLKSGGFIADVDRAGALTPIAVFCP